MPSAPHITRVDAAAAEAALPELCALLKEVVDDGASIGFLPPLGLAEAEAYWRGRIAALRAGEIVLWLARYGGLAGTIQLGLPSLPNASHRAEVQKLMVGLNFRRQGMAAMLLQALEAHAERMGKRLLVLDTRLGDDAERLYQRFGYRQAGMIPRYAINPDGTLASTVLYFKFLDA